MHVLPQAPRGDDGLRDESVGKKAERFLGGNYKLRAVGPQGWGTDTAANRFSRQIMAADDDAANQVEATYLKAQNGCAVAVHP